VRGICPEGWHLPDSDELNTLSSFVRNSIAGNYPNYALQARGYDSWPNATDTLGFSALPAGYYDASTGTFNGVGEYGDFWSATEEEGLYYLAYYWNLSNFEVTDKSIAFPVRCLQDD
jgi:uncharacterized protein (TIGR02145 family)